MGDPEPFRIRNTPEDRREMETHLAWVATCFAEEISCLEQVPWELVRQYDLEGLESDDLDAAVMRELLAFIEGYNDPR
jgi:hypothetical protein